MDTYLVAYDICDPKLGKTSVIALWLIALANNPTVVPRRLVYVVNRRTVVDQSTEEAKKLRDNLPKVPELQAELGSLAISTVRGQFADNREWSADPSRPAVIVGTVDMIGSRLLFSGYGVGFKAKPLHAGFLGQDVLLVHDEAHLEPAFQDLLIAIQKEQERSKEFGKFRVMELSATSRGTDAFSLSDADRAEPEVQKRINAVKAIMFHPIDDEKKQLADKLVELALVHRDSQRAILVFARSVEAVTTIVAALRKTKQEVQQLTGTLRGLERDRLTKDDPIFARFLPPSNRSADVGLREGTVYLVCTSAGEVGVNISADHLVCDLSTFDSMAQRFGRVNRFGDRDDTRIDIVYPTNFDEKELDIRRSRTLELLKQLKGNGSPAALGDVDLAARLAAFAPPPVILPTSDILFDAWALTTIREKLPGRPPVEPYLHGISEWEPPQTTVAWREEVGIITGELLDTYKSSDLLEDYPLKPHELLRDSTFRKNSGVQVTLTRLAQGQEHLPVWMLDLDGAVSVGTLADVGNVDLVNRTVILPPQAGGLTNGLLTAEPYDPNRTNYDVADEWPDEKGNRRRVRVWDDDPLFDEKTDKMRLIRPRMVIAASEDDEDAAGRFWYWYVRPRSADDDGSTSSRTATTWDHHTRDVESEAKKLADALLEAHTDLHTALVLAARFHDLGKKRAVWQTYIGNKWYPNEIYAKPGPLPDGRELRVREITDYRHEFGSLLDLQRRTEFDNLKHKPELQDLILHLIAVHHGYGRPHFPEDRAFDPEPPKGVCAGEIAAEVPRRFARLQRKYGRWGLAYLESLLRAADWAASANPTAFVEEKK
jgi:CRISPR-associated endonuclease/helicase Cas3